MKRYDEDSVITLLRQSVPPPPDVADRVAAIRARAGRQRAAVWSQTLGAVASVLLVVGVAAAVSGPGTNRRVDPLQEPLIALSNALGDERSVRFEASTRFATKPTRNFGSITPSQLAALAESRVTGAATRDGDLRVDGDASLLDVFALGAYEPGHSAATERHFRVVDGVAYRSAMPGEDVPPGKTWVKETTAGERADVTTLQRQLRLVAAVATKVRYVGEAEHAGTPLAEYTMTIPPTYTPGEPIEIRFFLDDRTRLRRVVTEFAFSEVFLGSSEELVAAVPPSGEGSPEPEGVPTMMPSPAPGELPGHLVMEPLDLRVEVNLFGYGEDVTITAPPANEVVPSEELYGIDDSNDIGEIDESVLQACFDKAKTDRERAECFRASTYGPMPGYPSTSGAPKPQHGTSPASAPLAPLVTATP